MQGTIILTVIFSITLLFIGIKIFKESCELLKRGWNSVTADGLAQLVVSIFLYVFFLIAAVCIINKQYDLDKQQSYEVVVQED